MAYEFAEQMDWTWPDWIVYPDRRRHRHGRDVEGVRRDRAHRLGAGGRGRGWCRCRPRACAPIVRAFPAGRRRAEPWEDASNDRRRPARAARDWRLPDPSRRPRERRHRARRRTKRWSTACSRSAGTPGLSIAAPEGGAALVAVQRLVADGSNQAARSVVLFNTGGALKYLDVILPPAPSALSPHHPVRPPVCTAHRERWMPCLDCWAGFSSARSSAQSRNC